ncbi:hypothetical protein COBT_000030 [Conglomerata obtusa]
MSGTTFYVKEFSTALYDLLLPYNDKDLKIMLSGGSLLSLFEDKIFSNLKASKWQIYFSDERLTDEFNIDEARKRIKFTNNFNDLRNKNIEKVDIAILSVGEDGHVASLFPNHSALDSTGDLIYVNDSPKPPKERITVSINYLNSVNKLVFMIPKKNGVVKNIIGPHLSILSKLSVPYEIYLDSSLLPKK